MASSPDDAEGPSATVENTHRDSSSEQPEVSERHQNCRPRPHSGHQPLLGGERGGRIGEGGKFQSCFGLRKVEQALEGLNWDEKKRNRFLSLLDIRSIEAKGVGSSMMRTHLCRILQKNNLNVCLCVDVKGEVVKEGRPMNERE